MVPSLTVDMLLVVGAWAVYFPAAWLVSRAIRPRAVEPAPPTPDLPAGPPPAIVNYLVHGCRTDAGAAPATLVDLAARHYIELLQPGTDPEQTLIRVRNPNPAGLTAYERRVLDRVVETAGPDGAVSLADLSHRYADDGFLWSVQFAKEVAADAKERKLAAEGADGVGVLFIFIGFLLTCPTAFLPIRLLPDRSNAWLSLGLCLVLWFGLLIASVATITAWFSVPRRTAAGRAATAEWLGVAAWLRAHEAFADLPTASVAVWDRYLAYGTALGTNPVVSDAVDLGVGSSDVLWSTYTGTRRQVQVEYRGRGRLAGYHPRSGIITHGLWTLIVGLFLWYGLTRWSSDLPIPAVTAIGLIGAAVVGWGLYLVVRSAVDLFQPVEVTGLVLSRSSLPQSLYVDDLREFYPSGEVAFGVRLPDATERVYYLVVDDGSADRLPLWTVAPPKQGGDCREGDIVQLSAYRRCRYADSVKVVKAAQVEPLGDARQKPVRQRRRARRTR